MSEKPVVLIVDDDPFLLDVVRRVLVRGGYAVKVANCGSEAVDAYRSCAEQIFAVVLDMQMPEMDGVDTYLALREVDPDVRVILTSGFGEVDTEARAGRQLDTIGKPYSPSVLLEHLGRFGRNEA